MTTMPPGWIKLTYAATGATVYMRASSIEFVWKSLADDRTVIQCSGNKPACIVAEPIEAVTRMIYDATAHET